MILVLDFGSQYTQLIARRLREKNVYCEIHPYNKMPTDRPISGVVLSGSPFSVLDTNALKFDLQVIINKYPILAICYGSQLIAHELGGEVMKSNKREYGNTTINITKFDPLFENLPPTSQVWMSHSDSIHAIPDTFEPIAISNHIIAAYRSKDHVYTYPVYCLQFHPEVTHTLFGKDIIDNFVSNIVKCKTDWTPASVIHDTVKRLKEKIGDDHVLMGLSGGVDSTVAATLIHKAVGDRLHCIFVDNGLLRKNEYDEVLQSYQGMGLNVKGVTAGQLFLERLNGVSDPEAKRKIIGKTFIDVFEAESKKIPNIKFLGQGTIYPDVIESVSVHGPSVTIKSHHNVGGLPDVLQLTIVEPLRMLFKDEVRKIGQALNISPTLLERHPFPGPGLGIRILGDISIEKIKLCQDADAIFINNLKKSGWYNKVWQAGAILLPVRSVGVMGDERTYEYTIALRCVQSIDGMTAEWSPLPYDLLANISNEIINTVKGINRVVYDISTKPPATIEWE